MKNYIIIFFLLIYSTVFSQKDISNIFQKAQDLAYAQPNEANRICDSLLNNKSTSNSHKAKINLIKGDVYWAKSDFDSALIFYEKALDLSKINKKDDDVCRALSSVGYVYMDKGNMSKAIDFYLQFIELNKGRFQSLQKSNYSYIALAYSNLLDSTNSFYYYREAYQMALKENNIHSQANYLTNMANLYFQFNDLNKAEKMYNQALKMHKGDTPVEYCGVLSNLGILYLKKKEYKTSILKLNEAYSISKKNNLKTIEMKCLTGLGEANLNIGNSALADSNFTEAIRIVKNSNSKLNIKSITYDISRAYASSLNFKKAYELLNYCMMYNDSLVMEENQKLMAQNGAKYGLIQKQASINLLKKDNELANEKMRADKKIKILLLIIVIVILIGAYFIFNRYKLTIKQKHIIEEKQKETDLQKKEIEERQKEILDSIRYAKRIQTALLPSEKLIGKNLKKLNQF